MKKYNSKNNPFRRYGGRRDCTEEDYNKPTFSSTPENQIELSVNGDEPFKIDSITWTTSVELRSSAEEPAPRVTIGSFCVSEEKDRFIETYMHLLPKLKEHSNELAFTPPTEPVLINLTGVNRAGKKASASLAGVLFTQFTNAEDHDTLGVSFVASSVNPWRPDTTV